MSKKSELDTLKDRVAILEAELKLLKLIGKRDPAELPEYPRQPGPYEVYPHYPYGPSPLWVCDPGFLCTRTSDHTKACEGD